MCHYHATSTCYAGCLRDAVYELLQSCQFTPGGSEYCPRASVVSHAIDPFTDRPCQGCRIQTIWLVCPACPRSEWRFGSKWGLVVPKCQPVVLWTKGPRGQSGRERWEYAVAAMAR